LAEWEENVPNKEFDQEMTLYKEAIDKYEEYLLQNNELMNSLHEIKGKTLGCWCKPKRCHGEILVKYANKGNKLF
jgi:hypothetical protein